MSSILNSISHGDLKVLTKPKETPIKKDSIVNLLKGSEIEFKSCPTLPNKLENFNTGFGKNNDLIIEHKCKKPKMKVPLYQDNYLSEFKTEEEKAAARHALGLFNKDDVVAMSLLTAKEQLPTSQEWLEATLKQMRQGDKFFKPITSFDAVFDLDGTSLQTKMSDIETLMNQQKKQIKEINEVSKFTEITSLGDVRMFLHGFKNGENLHDCVEEINQEMLRFEKTGEIL